MPGVSSGRVLGVVCAALIALALSAMPAGATSRIKDLANIEGVRQNQLIGYGLVVGLNGTGDTLNNIPFTKQSLQAMLERMGAEYPRRHHPHRQRRRRDGHRQPAPVRNPVAPGWTSRYPSLGDPRTCRAAPCW